MGIAITGTRGFRFERPWLSKGLKNIDKHPNLFSGNSVQLAQQKLGIGTKKNSSS